MAKAKSRRGKKRTWKFKLPIFLALAGVIGGLAYISLKKEKPAEEFPVLEINRESLVDKLAETGTIELVRTVEVKSTVAGEIRQLPVEAGDWVERDRLLAVIEPDLNQSLQLYQKRSAVNRGKIDLEEQEKDFNRKKVLFDRGLLSSEQFEDAQTLLTRIQYDLRLAELELEVLETKANLSKTQNESLDLGEVRVLAPISGIVIRRDVEIGEVVTSGLSAVSGGTLLFEIGDPSQMIIRGDIAEIDIAKLQVGQEVEVVVDAYSDTTYHGRVRWIAPVGQKKQGSPIVTFDTEIDILDREPLLRQGMSCDIDIIFSRRDSVLSLPTEAVIEDFGEDEEKTKGQKGRFIAYVVPADSLDSDNTEKADPEKTEKKEISQEGDTTATENPEIKTGEEKGRKKKKDEKKFELEKFVEVELDIGLETTTRIEVLSGLKEGDLVASDPNLIRRKLEQKKKEDEDAEEE